jgi:hypothetical protein
MSNARTLANTINSSSQIVVPSGGVNFGTSTDGTGTVTGGVMDDYEEGTWTPSIGNNGTFPSPGGSASYSGTYTKIGNIVTATMVLNFDVSGTNMAASNWIIMDDLPFSFSVGRGHGVGVSVPVLGAGNRAFHTIYNFTADQIAIITTVVIGTVNFGNDLNLTFSYFTS